MAKQIFTLRLEHYRHCEFRFDNQHLRSTVCDSVKWFAGSFESAPSMVTPCGCLVTAKFIMPNLIYSQRIFQFLKSIMNWKTESVSNSKCIFWSAWAAQKLSICFQETATPARCTNAIVRRTSSANSEQHQSKLIVQVVSPGSKQPC
jgi:hypothetical protein